MSNSRQVVLVGAKGVGKTAIFQRMLGKEYVDNVPPTLTGAFGEKTGRTYQLEINDTSGDDEYANTLPVVVMNTDVLIYVIDAKKVNEGGQYYSDSVTDFEEKRKMAGKSTKFYILFSKTDLLPEERDQRVHYEATKVVFSDKCTVFECSAKNNMGFDFTDRIEQDLSQKLSPKQNSPTAKPMLEVDSPDVLDESYFSDKRNLYQNMLLMLLFTGIILLSILTGGFGLGSLPFLTGAGPALSTFLADAIIPVALGVLFVLGKCAQYCYNSWKNRKENEDVDFGEDIAPTPMSTATHMNRPGFNLSAKHNTIPKGGFEPPPVLNMDLPSTPKAEKTEEAESSFLPNYCRTQ